MLEIHYLKDAFHKNDSFVHNNVGVHRKLTMTTFKFMTEMITINNPNINSYGIV